MGYANSWRWKIPIADADTFAEWSSDVRYLLDELSAPDRELPLYAYGGGPSAGEYPPVFYRTHIRGPTGRGEPVMTPTKVAFNGNGRLGEDGEPFIITLRDLKAPNPFASCKTKAEPYDLLVICALVRLVHYFPAVRIHCDGEEKTLHMAVRLCREILGDNVLPVLDDLQDEEESISD